MHTLALAPMVDRTDRHFRLLARLLNEDIFLYTEMLVDRAILRGDAERLLRFDPREHPVGLQLAGTNPAMMAKAAALAKNFSYDEINLNCGCPSPRANEASFGAILMKNPTVVAEITAAMLQSSSLPVSVKMRTGVDDVEDYDLLCRFVDQVAASGVKTFIIHARKAWLCGLSPKENRKVPPLRHEWVYCLKKDFPHLEIITNGGIDTLEQMKAHLQYVDGVMIGRAAYGNPWLLAKSALFFNKHPPLSSSVFDALLDYARTELDCGTKAAAIFRHWVNLFSGFPGARHIRQKFSKANPEEILTLLSSLKEHSWIGEMP
jgi:tRNA-dihydrouridine synthase A